MSYKKLIVLAAVVGGLGTGAVMAASPQQKIAERQANFKVIGKSFKGMLDEGRKPAPDINVYRSNADALAKAATKIAGHFPKGTGSEAGVKTAALPAIWAKPGDFKAAAAKLVAASAKLNATAKSGNIDATKAALMAVGPTCKGCHDQFKAKD
ncbi:cytochrome c [Novosphingobium sp. MW5]|nr:cytochrome c [Novosphingobium sp. MW5]